MRLVSRRAPEGLRSAIQVRSGDLVDTARLARLVGLPDEVAAELVSNRAVVALPPERLRLLAEAADHQTSSAAVASHGLLTPSGQARLGPPVADPQKVICVGLNYRDHAAEVGAPPPPSPMYFAKFANSLAGPHDPIIPPRSTTQVDYEAELAVVIGRRGRYIDTADALDHVWGAMAFNDLSARDLQLANQLWTTGKAVDSFAPCGPALVSRDEIVDLHNLPVSTRVNGHLVQNGSTASMIFDIPALVSFISEVMTLEPGDIIATGTPAGVGQSRTPPLFLQPGDVVEVWIQGIGTLRNTVLPAQSFSLEGSSA